MKRFLFIIALVCCIGVTRAQDLNGTWKLSNYTITPVSETERPISEKNVIWRDIIKDGLKISIEGSQIKNFVVDGKPKEVRYELIDNNTIRVIFIDNAKENKISYTEYSFKSLPNGGFQLTYLGKYATEVYNFSLN